TVPAMVRRAAGRRASTDPRRWPAMGEIAPGSAHARGLPARRDRAAGKLPLPAPHLLLAYGDEWRAAAGRGEEPWPQFDAHVRAALWPLGAVLRLGRGPRTCTALWFQVASENHFALSARPSLSTDFDHLIKTQAISVR